MLSLNSNLGDVQMVIGITVDGVHADALFYKNNLFLKNCQKPTATSIYTNNIQYKHIIHPTTSYKYIIRCKSTLMFRKYMFIKLVNNESSSTYICKLKIINRRV